MLHDHWKPEKSDRGIDPDKIMDGDACTLGVEEDVNVFTTAPVAVIRRCSRGFVLTNIVWE